MNPDPENESSGTQFTVYWQPGSSSCLRTKEFLKENGIAFRSVNVREDESAIQTLGESELSGLPMPEEVYDGQVLLTPTHGQAAKVLLIRNINKNQRLYHRQSG